MTCPKCGSEKTQKRGFQNGKQRNRCFGCGEWFTTEIGTDSKRTYSFKEENNKGELSVVTPQRITSLEQLIKFCEIDTKIWEVERFVCNKWEVGVKNKNDSITTAPLFQVKAWLKKKVEEILVRNTVDDLIKDAKKFAPKYPTIKYNKIIEKFLFEPDMPDIHFGKLAWAEESGDDYDIKIAEQMALETIISLVRQASVYSIDRIIFPIGNDYFNVNSKLNETIHGTIQQEDTRSAKTFKKGRELAVKMIDLLTSIAPVDVIIVPGNHDEERTFYLGDSLECWYNNSKNVKINNQAKKRKYYSYGKNLIGFTHGYYEKLNELPLIMSLEQKELWAQSEFREWQTGDKHHKKEIKTSLKENEQKGVMVRILRSISGNDAWHFDKGFVGQNRTAEAFVRHFDKGLVAQFTSAI